MGALTRMGAFACLLAVMACAVTPPSSIDNDEEEALWGDEYAGIGDDTDLEEALAYPQRTHSFTSIDVLADPSLDGVGALRSLAASARYRGAGLRYRESAYGRAGAIELFRVGWLQHLVVGAMRPVVGEGALVADARDLGTPSARATPSASALRVAPSSSLWGSVWGAGMVLGTRRARVGMAAWQSHDDDSTWTTWLAPEFVVARTRIGVSVGRAQRASQPVHSAGSILVAHAFRSAFVSVETALANARPMCAVRVVAGDVWRAGFAAGMPASSDVPIGSALRDRRMAVLERRDRWRRVSSRLVMSSVARRSGFSTSKEDRRRRVDLSLRTAIDEGARVEAGVRFLASDATTAPTPLQLGEHERRDEWRARVVLSVREEPSSAVELEHMFRIDAVRARGSPGIAGTWRGSIRWGRFDGRLQASAWGLEPGDLGYLGRGGLPGAGAFTTISGSGRELSAMVRARLGLHAGVATEWRRKASGVESVLIAASLDW